MTFFKSSSFGKMTFYSMTLSSPANWLRIPTWGLIFFQSALYYSVTLPILTSNFFKLSSTLFIYACCASALFLTVKLLFLLEGLRLGELFSKYCWMSSIFSGFFFGVETLFLLVIFVYPIFACKFYELFF